jgi:hypothetical protein
MKQIFLLKDESTRPRQLLQDGVRTKIPFRESEAVAGCNSDRWGHPYPRYVERVVQPKADVPRVVGDPKMK